MSNSALYSLKDPCSPWVGTMKTARAEAEAMGDKLAPYWSCSSAAGCVEGQMLKQWEARPSTGSCNSSLAQVTCRLCTQL